MCLGGNYLRQNWKAAFVLCIVFLGFARGKGAIGSCIVGPVFGFMVPLKSFSKSEGLRQTLVENLLFQDTLITADC